MIDRQGVRWATAVAVLLSTPADGVNEGAQHHPSALDFGQVPVAAARELGVALTHDGVAPLWVTEISIHGISFELPAPPVTASARLVPVADTLLFGIVFQPGEPGYHVGRIDILSAADTTTILLEAEATAVVIDEILADPPTGSAGDANGDGTRNTYRDEFVEIFQRRLRDGRPLRLATG